MPSKFADDVRAQLEGLKAKYGTLKKMSEAVGISTPSLCRWLKGQQSPTTEELGKVFDREGIGLALPGLPLAEFDFVPKMAARAGGGSSLVTAGGVERRFPFPKGFLQQNGMLSPERVSLFTVIGSSMSPLIADGDVIMVDGNDTAMFSGHIYLIGLDDELLVKHVQKTPGGWLLSSQNPAFSPIPVRAEDSSLLRVYGRVKLVLKNV